LAEWGGHRRLEPHPIEIGAEPITLPTLRQTKAAP
jgi:hypothetical protein